MDEALDRALQTVAAVRADHKGRPDNTKRPDRAAGRGTLGHKPWMVKRLCMVRQQSGKGHADASGWSH